MYLLCLYCMYLFCIYCVYLFCLHCMFINWWAFGLWPSLGYREYCSSKYRCSDFSVLSLEEVGLAWQSRGRQEPGNTRSNGKALGHDSIVAWGWLVALCRWGPQGWYWTGEDEAGQLSDRESWQAYMLWDGPKTQDVMIWRSSFDARVWFRVGSGRSSGEGNGNPCQLIPWTEEPGRLQSTGSQESDMT